MDQANLPLHVAVDLLHSLVQHIAKSVGVPVVFIKGPALVIQGIRPRSVGSGDVDVLVSSACEVMIIADAMSSLGWYPRPEGRINDVFHNHAIALIHESWPCDVDLHFDFPGVERYHIGGFSALHADHQTVELASGPIAVPSLTHHVLIAALNDLRSPHSPKAVRRLTELHDMVARRLTEEAEFATELLDAATSLGALGPARSFLEGLGLRPATWPPPGAEWRSAVRATESGSRWAFALRDAPLKRKPMLAFQAFVPPREVILGHDLYASQGGGVSLARAYGDRLLRGVRFCRRVTRRRAEDLRH